jgi:hypothetical protein
MPSTISNTARVAKLAQTCGSSSRSMAVSRHFAVGRSALTPLARQLQDHHDQIDEVEI